MRLDIRLPLGLLFALVGLLLVAQGLFGASQLTAQTAGINIDLWWGVAMAAFGGLVLALSRRG
jgi:steroid 5-alpha reductase family enzyme